jgi:hypothetical protein
MIGDDGIKTVPAGKQSAASGEAEAADAAGPAAASRILNGFVPSIRSPNLKAVVAHWVQAKGREAMPSWEQLSPARIAPQLPLIWAYRYDRELDRFSGRLAGDKICQIFGKNIRGLSLDEIFPADAVDWTHRLYRRVVREPALYHSAGAVFSHLKRWGIGERVILPLSSDGVLGDGILGATDYHYPHPSASSEGDAGSERWFCLRPERHRADPC